MERRRAITVAGAASLTLLAGAAGIAINSGIVGSDGDDHVGRVSLTDSTLSPNGYISEETYPRTFAPFLESPTIATSDATPVTTSSASATDGRDDDDKDHDDKDHDDKDHDDKDHDDKDHDDKDHDDKHEYEGADDDD